LLIEIGGATAGTGDGFYDQINISGAAVLDGTLAVDLWNGYKPTDGQVFNVMNFGSVTGKFDVGTGLLKTNDGVFFEVSQGATSLTLTARTIDPSLDYILDVLDANPADDLGLGVSQTNQIGQWLNYNYFQDVAPVTFNSSLNLDNKLTASGNFTLGYNADVPLTPVGGTALNTNVWSLSANDLTAFMGVAGKGLALTNLDLNLAFVQADNTGYGWVMGQGTLDSASISGITGLNLSGTNLALDFNWGYGDLAGGAANDSLLNLTATPITVGSSTFNNDGSRGEYLLASGTLAGSVGEVSLSATVGVSIIGSDFVMAGHNVSASLAAGGMSAGLSSGSVWPGVGCVRSGV
jgi:hypothetical protein